MSITAYNRVPYNRNPNNKKDEEIRTEGIDKESEKKKSKGIPDDITKAILNMTMPRLFLILSMITYSIIAYSKREKGVEVSDLSLFIFFILFILTVFVTLVVSKHLWNNFIDIFKKIGEFNGKDFKNYLKLKLLKLKLIILIFLIAILISVIFNVQIITDFIGNSIEIFANL